MAKDNEDKTEAPQKKSPVMLIVLLVNMLLVAGVVGFFLMRPTASAGTGGGGDVGAMGGGATVDATNFITSEMQPYILNLSDEDGNRYLKLQVVVRLRSEEAKERFSTLKPAVRDRFIQHITSLRMQDLGTPDDKKELKRALVEQANEVLIRGDVVDVFFTDFVVQ